jgi:LysR family transcriptional activator of nhaA
LFEFFEASQDVINGKGLYYFWTVAKASGIARADERLHLTPQTISGQINLLQENLGETLLNKAGRNPGLTEYKRMVLSYTDKINSFHSELEVAVHSAHPAICTADGSQYPTG